MAEHWVLNMWPDIHLNYTAQDIYNCDKTGLYFQAVPEGTMCFQTEKLSGNKKAKAHLTVLLTANMDGSDKIKSLVIRKSAKPRCTLKGWASPPISHKANKNI